VKIYATVHTAEDCGDTFRIVAQGKTAGAPDWQVLSLTINTPNSDRSQKTYHVGRNIVVTLEPGRA
jgi:hypothetical protein